MNLLATTFGSHSSLLVRSKSVNMPHPNSQILLIINQEYGLDEGHSLTILRSLIGCVSTCQSIFIAKMTAQKLTREGAEIM